MSGPPTAIAPLVQRGLWLDSALDEMRRDLEEDRFVSAIGHFREALGVSRGFAQLKARVNEQAEVYSEELLPRNWRVAEAILYEAAATEPALTPDPELLAKVKQARQDELISSVLYKVDRLELDGKKAEAREKLTEILAAHPNEARIQERMRAFDPPPAVMQTETVVEAPAVAVAQAPVSEIEASPEVVTAPEPAAAEEHEREMEVPLPAFLREPAKPRPTKVLISTSAWNAIKDLTAVVATAAMLGTAGLLVWKHFTEPAPRLRPVHAVATPAKGAEPASPVASAPSGNSVFQDVPVPPSDQDVILQAVRSYSETNGKNLDGAVVDEVDIQGKQAKVRYRPKDNPAGAKTVFSLIKLNDGWKVQRVE